MLFDRFQITLLLLDLCVVPDTIFCSHLMILECRAGSRAACMALVICSRETLSTRQAHSCISRPRSRSYIVVEYGSDSCFHSIVSQYLSLTFDILVVTSSNYSKINSDLLFDFFPKPQSDLASCRSLSIVMLIHPQLLSGLDQSTNSS